MKLLAANYKLEKSVPGHKLLGLSLAPHTVAGGPSVCKYSTPECREVCLGTTTGLNVLPAALKAKIARTKLWQDSPAAFKQQLLREVHAAAKSATKAGLKLALRLNVYSDVLWEREYPELFAAYPAVQFYDYTKWPGRTDRPANYHLTYSYSGTAASDKAAADYLAAGTNVAVVFSPEVPELFKLGEHVLPVVDGDISDFRPGDPSRCIVGLKFKGPRDGLVQLRRFVQKLEVR